MKPNISKTGIFLPLMVTALVLGCGGDDNPTIPPPEGPSYVPEIPVPDSPNDVLPGVSEVLTVGLSQEIETFKPYISQIQMMDDGHGEPWLTANRPLLLACPNRLPEYSSDPAITTNRTYITARPRLAHQRYWRKIDQVTLVPGSESYEWRNSVTYGTSTSHEESRQFSQTVGVEVSASAGWGAFSASVTGYFEQTATVGEVNSVTFWEESSIEKRFTVPRDPRRTKVWAIWQLVDKFALVDADTVAIHQSSTLAHVRIPAIAGIAFPNQTMIRESVTYFN